MHVNMTNVPGDAFRVHVESTTIGGKPMFRLLIDVARDTVDVWLMPEQLQQLGFAVSCAEQEADLQQEADLAARRAENLRVLNEGLATVGLVVRP